VREHNEAVNRLDFWPNRDAISVEYNEGDAISVPQHDGSIIHLRKTTPSTTPPTASRRWSTWRTTRPKAKS